MQLVHNAGKRGSSAKPRKTHVKPYQNYLLFLSVAGNLPKELRSSNKHCRSNEKKLTNIFC